MLPSRSGVVRVLGAVDRDQREAMTGRLTRDASAGDLVARHRRFLVELPQRPQRQVVHHVTDLVDTVDDSLGPELIRGSRRWAEQQRGEMVGGDPVDLLGHRAVERPQPGLDVADGDPQLGRRKGTCQRRVRVAVDDDEIGRGLLERCLDTDEHLPRLRRIGCRCRPRAPIDEPATRARRRRSSPCSRRSAVPCRGGPL